MGLITQHQIDHFLQGKTIAIAGASRKEKSFSAQVAKHLEQLGYNIWYVNPNFKTTNAALNQVSSISELPGNVNHAIILTNKSQTGQVMQQAVEKGIKNVWIQQQSETPEALKMGIDNQINTIHHQCIFMFTQPTGIHKFHRQIKHFFGRLPK